MFLAVPGHQEDLLVVQARERILQRSGREDTRVACSQQRLALGVNGLQGELADLLAREGTLDLLPAHVDGAAGVITVLLAGFSGLADGLIRLVVAPRAQALVRFTFRCADILEDVAQETVGGACDPIAVAGAVVGHRVPDPR